MIGKSEISQLEVSWWFLIDMINRFVLLLKLGHSFLSREFEALELHSLMIS